MRLTLKLTPDVADVPVTETVRFEGGVRTLLTGVVEEIRLWAVTCSTPVEDGLDDLSERAMRLLDNPGASVLVVTEGERRRAESLVGSRLCRPVDADPFANILVGTGEEVATLLRQPRWRR